MPKFYKIPLTERAISAHSTSLYEILREKHPILYDREVGRIELLYGALDPNLTTEELERRERNYNSRTAEIYGFHQVPQYLIAIDRDDGAITELATHTELSGRHNSIFKIREVSGEEATKYFKGEPSYFEAMSNFLTLQKENRETKKPFERIKAIFRPSQDN